jgi:hypothetical protein
MAAPLTVVSHVQGSLSQVDTAPPYAPPMAEIRRLGAPPASAALRLEVGAPSRSTNPGSQRSPPIGQRSQSFYLPTANTRAMIARASVRPGARRAQGVAHSSHYGCATVGCAYPTVSMMVSSCWPRPTLAPFFGHEARGGGDNTHLTTYHRYHRNRQTAAGAGALMRERDPFAAKPTWRADQEPLT